MESAPANIVCFLPAFWGTLPHLRDTPRLLPFGSLQRSLPRVRPWPVSALIPRRPLLACVSSPLSGWSEMEWRGSFIRTMPCSSLWPRLFFREYQLQHQWDCYLGVRCGLSPCQGCALRGMAQKHRERHIHRR